MHRNAGEIFDIQFETSIGTWQLPISCYRHKLIAPGRA